MNTGIQVCTSVRFKFFGYIHKCGIARLHDNPTFNFLRKSQTTFHSSCAFYILISNIEGSISPNPHQHFLLSVYFYYNHPSKCESVNWYLTKILIYISLITNDVEHSFMWLLVTCISSWERCKRFVYSSSSFIFKLDWLFFAAEL